MPYVTLTEDSRYIKPVSPFAVLPEDGITQTEVTAAETNAMRVTKAKVGWMYDISTWEATTPPIIEYINELLASAEVLEFYLNRDTDVTLGAEFEPDRLRGQADAWLEGIRSGDLEVLDSSDVLIPKKMIAPRQGPKTSACPATFYPCSRYRKSFGQRPHFSAQKTFEDT